MMSVIRVKVIGAGSIGNHLAQACRRVGWTVAVVDRDPVALRRMKEDIYPSRYGAWDNAIQLYTSTDEPVGCFDVIFVGTPPDTHMEIATRVLQTEAPRVLQIEKPLCTPNMVGVAKFLHELQRHKETMVVVGYDHVLGENTEVVEQYIDEKLGELITLDVSIRFDWQPILAAHPWLSGPQDTYLGFWRRGGGAGGEHSHGLNLWQHFAHVVGAGRVTEVHAVFDYVKGSSVEYDRLCFLTLITEGGLKGRVVQDVVTYPEEKNATLQFENGRIVWYLGAGKDLDRVIKSDRRGQVLAQQDTHKKRPDDFFREIFHIAGLLDGTIAYEDSPIKLERGLDTMRVLSAAHKGLSRV